MEAKRLGSARVYSGKVISVDQDRVLLPNGQEATLEVVRHPGAAAVVALESDGRVLLLRQYRWAAGGYVLEVPAGKLDPGEEPEACAHRELEEETGRRAETMARLGSVWTTPGFTDELIHLFLATDLRAGEQHLDRDEILEVVGVPLAEVPDMMARGDIRDAKSMCALALALNQRAP